MGHGDHSLHVRENASTGPLQIVFRIRAAKGIGLFLRKTSWIIAVQRIMSGRLVGHNIRNHATPQEFRVHLCSVSNQTHAARNSVQLCLLNDVQRLIQVAGHSLQISMTDCLLDRLPVDFYCQSDAIIHGYGQRLSTPHLAQARRQYESCRESSVKVFLGDSCERFVCALEYTLGSDVSPGPCGHLSVHDETLLLKFVEIVPSSPLGNNHAVNNQDSRGQSVGFENCHWLAALYEECLIFAELL